MAKNDTFGLSIGLDTSSLKAGLQDAGRRIKEASAEFSEATAGMDDWRKSSEGLSAKLKQLNSNLAVQKSVLELIEKEYEEAGYAQDDMSKAAIELRTQIANQKATIGQTEKNLKKFSDELKEVSKAEKETENASGNTNKSLNEQKDAAKQAGDGFTVLKGTMANLLSAGVEKLIEGLGKLKDAFFDTIGQADELLTTSSQTGVSVEKLQELQYAAELVDVELETVTNSMAKNIKSMTNYAKGSKDVVAAYDKLGVSVTNADGSLRDSEEVYWDLITALGKVENETERDSLAMSILGKSAQDLNPLILAGADTMKELADEAHRTGYVMSDETVSALGEADDVVQRAKNSFTSFKNELVATLLSEIDLEEAQKTFNDTLTKFKDEVLPKVIEGFKWVKDHLPEITKAAIALSSAFVGMKVASIISGIVKAMKAWTVATKGMTIAQKALNLVMKANVIGAIIGLVIALVGYIVHLWKTNEKFRDAVIKIWDKVKQAFSVTIEFIKNIFLKALDFIKSYFMFYINLYKAIWNGLVSFFTSLWNGIKKVFSSVGEWFSNVFTAAKNGIVNAFNSVLGFFQNLWTKIKNVFSSVGSFFGGIWTTIKDKFTDIGQKIGESISGAFKKAINGVLKTAEKVLNAPIKAINGLIDKVQDVVKISKLKTFDLPRMAKGGIVDRATLGIFGEAGQEAVIPLERNLGWIKKLSANIVKEMQVPQMSGIVNQSPITNTTNFTQIINAPSQPPLDDMYRNTKNLLNLKAVTN